jgi:hypothetical protein
MNRSTPGSSGHRSTPGSTLEYSGSPPSVPLSAALVAFTNAKFAEGLSPRTIASYTVDLGKWIERTGDRDTSSITASASWPWTSATPMARSAAFSRCLTNWDIPRPIPRRLSGVMERRGV